MTDIIGLVLRTVARHFDVSVDDILSTRRSRDVLPARHVAAYLAHVLSGAAPADIGARLGGRDSTIIAMYCRTVARRAAEDEAFKCMLHDLEQRLRSRTDWS